MVAKETREFGREITQNNGSAMQAVNQQTGLIMQGKLKPNVSVSQNRQHPLMSTLFSETHQIALYLLQQVGKKTTTLTYRTNAISEKPVNAFNSTTSLGPL